MENSISFKKMGINPPYDPAIPFSGIHPRETKIEKRRMYPNVNGLALRGREPEKLWAEVTLYRKW